jgi:hypothetical protein
VLARDLHGFARRVEKVEKATRAAIHELETDSSGALRVWARNTQRRTA